MQKSVETTRSQEAKRNPDLEALLTELNDALGSCSRQPSVDSSESVPKIFVFGPMRSGTTLMMQCLSQAGPFAYPTNLLSRFYKAPLVGTLIQQMLFDPRFQFRDEMALELPEHLFSSYNGKTSGPLSPNEFWYFWKRFIPFVDGRPEAPTGKQAKAFQAELNGIANKLTKPFALKAMILNEHADALYSLFPGSLFIRMVRDPVFNIQSALEARQRQFGDMETWYSFKIKAFDELKELDPLHAVAGQVHAINQAIELGFANIPDTHQLTVPYEAFCDTPGTYLKGIAEKIQEHVDPDHWRELPEKFKTTNQWRLSRYTEQAARDASEKMERFIRNASSIRGSESA